MTKVDIAVVGAGLTGSLLACYLARRGHQVSLYERRPDPRAGGGERGRSINLALSERGLDALRRIGLERQVMADALPMHGRMIHPVAGPGDFQPYSRDGDKAINSISRGALNNALIDAAEAADGVTLHFGHRLTGLDPVTGALRFETSEGTVPVRASVVLGADGAGSATRAQLVEAGVIREDVEFLDHGYKELTIPAVDGEFALDPGALHIWPRGNAMMIALPNPDRSFTCTLFWPSEGASGFASLDTPAAVKEHFEARYPDLPPLSPGLVEDYLANPVGRLGTVRCDTWHVPGGRTALIGDAAHAIVPFYGQGANCAFEDVVELDRCLTETAGTWELALPRYEKRRKDNADAIARMALENFIEMRDKVASPVFKFTRKSELALQRALPGVWTSRYELVSFSTKPYAQVERRAKHQWGFLAGAATVAGIAAAIGLRRIAFQNTEPMKPQSGFLPGPTGRTSPRTWRLARWRDAGPRLPRPLGAGDRPRRPRGGREGERPLAEAAAPGVRPPLA